MTPYVGPDRAWDTALPRGGRTPVSLGFGAPVMLPGEAPAAAGAVAIPLPAQAA